MTAVFGVPMNRGNTPREAAQAWLALYGSIFDDGTTFGSPDLRDFAEFRLKNERTVFAYNQRIDGLEVEGSMGRIMVYDGPPAQVVYVSANVAKRPPGGLPAARVSAANALATARQHAVGTRLAQWGEPEMVAMIDPTRGREAMRVWKVAGAGGRESYTFRVNAATGEVVDYFSNISEAFDQTVSGNVNGLATPGLDPDSSDPNCLNLPVSSVLPHVRVEGIDIGTGQVLDTTFADANGDYVLTFSDDVGQVQIRASLAGPAWGVFSSEGQTLFPCPPQVQDSQTVVTAVPAIGTNITFNTPATEFGTAGLNAQINTFKSREYYKSRLPAGEYLGLDETIEVQINLNKGTTRAALLIL